MEANSQPLAPGSRSIELPSQRSEHTSITEPLWRSKAFDDGQSTTWTNYSNS